MAISSIESITRDLESEKPVWPLSCYGPAKMQPTLIGGLDESMEELRVRATQAAKAGTTQDYVRLSIFHSADTLEPRSPLIHVECIAAQRPVRWLYSATLISRVCDVQAIYTQLGALKHCHPPGHRS